MRGFLRAERDPCINIREAVTNEARSERAVTTFLQPRVWFMILVLQWRQFY